LLRGNQASLYDNDCDRAECDQIAMFFTGQLAKGILGQQLGSGRQPVWELDFLSRLYGVE
jgi:hypothetical protein